MDQRIGFCCKLLPEQEFTKKKDATAWMEAHNTKSTTVAYLEKLSRSDMIEKICAIIEHNQQALITQFNIINTWAPALRMVRMGSELLPVKTFDRLKWMYDEPVVKKCLEGFASVGELARSYDIRLSSHPGPFTILTSDSADVVDRAVEDLEYHADIFRLMGYDATDQRQEINIHGGPKRDDFVERFNSAFARLSVDTQQWISLENDEFSYGLDDLLPLAPKVKICVDINHYWIKEGEYLQPDDTRMQQVVQSWRGARPEIHVAWPKESVLTDHVDLHTLPDMQLLEQRGYKKSKLRAHADDAWIPAINAYALSFWPQVDLMVEAKWKNLASKKLYNTSVGT